MTKHEHTLMIKAKVYNEIWMILNSPASDEYTYSNSEEHGSPDNCRLGDIYIVMMKAKKEMDNFKNG